MTNIMMECALCTRCSRHQEDPTSCVHGGPFAGVVASAPIDVHRYIGRNYGEALPPRRIGGVWHSRFMPYGQRAPWTWQEKTKCDDARV